MFYTAKSLEDIAKLYDSKAQAADERANRESTTRKSISTREAWTWREAAAILRNTELMQDIPRSMP